MANTAITDEMLMAYADGELAAAEADEVAAATAADPDLAGRLARFVGTRAALTDLAAVPPEPLSPGLSARVGAALAASRGEATVVPFPAPASRRPTWQPQALAAGLVLAVGLAGGYLLGPRGGPPPGLRVASLEQPQIEAALSELPAGARANLPGGEIALIASFRNADGEICREFEFDGADRDTIVAVACHSDGRWQTRFAVVAGGADPSGYAPASSLETLDAYLAAIGASPPIQPEEEARALADL